MTEQPAEGMIYRDGRTGADLGLEGEVVFTLELRRTSDGNVFAEVDAMGITKVEAGICLIRAGEALVQDAAME